MQCICSIYRCSKKEGMYLYVDKKIGLEKIPEALMRQVGQTELAMTLLIDSNKKLARANAADVLASIDEKGFYLQMPPVLHGESEKEMSHMRDKNSKL
jgi:uncharacterized protein YcgL (UPF0745 family)